MTKPSGTVAFLFTDIEGSTRHWEEDRELMAEDLAKHDALIRRVVDEAGGFVFKTIGDAFCAAFPATSAAVAAALELQLAMKEASWKVREGIKVRVAVHAGEAVERDADYFGPTVNRVSRLLSAGHGGQTLLSSVAAELARESLPPGAHLKLLGVFRLKDLSEPQQVYQLDHENLQGEFPPLVTLDNRPNNLTPQPTRLIGREKDLAEVCRMLSGGNGRLLTLTGPGGSGKTRIALQAAADLCDVFEDGVFFVDLSFLKEADVVLLHVAQTLELRESMGQGRSVKAILTDYLRDRHLLLLLDNFEQVMAAASEIRTLLESTTRLKILTTSREALHLRGEREYPIPPLDLPALGQSETIQRLSQYESVRLFIERAQSVKPDFEVTAENAPAIAEICVRLDGLPLAIELAASRLGALVPRDLLKMLSGRLLQLKGAFRDLPARQQTLRSAIDWSYDLLAAHEKELFVRLAVFVGGFSLDACQEVCSDNEGEADMEFIDTVTSLVDKSLLKQSEFAGRTRFWMLEVICEYAAALFMDSDPAASIRARHAQHFLALAEDAAMQLHGADQMDWIGRLEKDNDNIRAALRWLLNAGKLDEAMRMLSALEWYWFRSGRFTEARALIDDVMMRAKPLLGTEAYAEGLRVQGWILLVSGEWAKAQAVTEESIATARKAESRRCEAHALANLGVAQRWSGSLDAGDRVSQKAIDLAKTIDDPFVGLRSAVWAYATTGGKFRGTPPEAELEKALGISRELHYPWLEAQALQGLGDLRRVQGRYDESTADYKEALALFRNLKDRWLIAWTLWGLGRTALATGNASLARDYSSESVSLFDLLGDRRDAVYTLKDLAFASSALGEVVRAATVFGAQQGLQRRLFGPQAADELEYTLEESESAEQLRQEKPAEWERGAAMEYEEAVRYALAAG